MPETELITYTSEITDLQLLVEHRESVQATETVENVYQWFHQHHQEYVGVVSGKQLAGIVSRGQIGFLLGARFGFAVYSRQAIRHHLMEEHLRVYQGTPLLNVLDQALSRHGDRFYDDVALVDAQDNFLGIIPVPTLVRWQSKLILQKTRLAEEQQLALQENNRQLFRSLNELRQSQGRYEILFENSALGVALLNSRGEVETCNHRLETLLGGKMAGGDSLFHDLSALVMPPEREAFLRLLQQQEENARTTAPPNAEFLLGLPGRGPRLFKFFVSWIRETGQICALLDDITEQRVLEHRMIQKEKSAMLDSLVGGIAHEINNKLAPIIGYAELLIGQIEQTKDAEKLAAYCATIRDSAIESAKIIRQLLHLSKPAAPDLSVCDLRALVREVLTVLRFRVRESGCEVTLDLPVRATPVLVDPAQVKQIIINLVLNGLDAMENAPLRKLQLGVAQKEDRVILSVADSGQGIRPENLHRIFDPFFTTKGPERGSGLGLSVCLSIVKEHGGEITVDSAAGTGTEFKITLPLASGEPLPPPATAAKPRGSNGSVMEPEANLDRLRVLIVDDEEFITGMVQEALRSRLHCMVERVHGGQPAVARLQRDNFDLVVSDVRMTGMDGFALFRWVQKHQPRLTRHFLFITGDAGSPDLNEKIESLGAPVLRKPFTIDTLVRECQKLARPPKNPLPE